nr:uncharacterized protein CI109_003827 [Kwoniella shandongensis]KAA5527855.1 hypothetical protein CI109_003827 [Kwoniella shandongensis]
MKSIRMTPALLPTLRRTTLSIIRIASKPDGPIDQGTFTMARARDEVEQAMGLEEGELGKGEWKKVVKGIVEDLMEKVQNEEEHDGSIAESSRSSSPPSSPKKMAKIAKQPKPTSRKRSPTPPVSSEEAEQVELRDDENDLESDMSSVYDVPPKSKKRGKSGAGGAEIGKGRKKVPKSKEEVLSDDSEQEPGRSTTKADEVADDSSEMSSVYDVPPSRAKAKSKGKRKSVSTVSSDEESARPKAKGKTKETKRTKKDPNEGLSPEEAKLADLKRIVVACGVRKQWSKEFADLPKVSSQISHVKQILLSLGMKGTPTLGKAKALKERRELAAELNDVREFEQVRGVSAEDGKRKTREQNAGSKKRTVQSESGSESEAESGAHEQL